MVLNSSFLFELKMALGIFDNDSEQIREVVTFLNLCTIYQNLRNIASSSSSIFVLTDVCMWQLIQIGYQKTNGIEWKSFKMNWIDFFFAFCFVFIENVRIENNFSFHLTWCVCHLQLIAYSCENVSVDSDNKEREELNLNWTQSVVVSEPFVWTICFSTHRNTYIYLCISIYLSMVVYSILYKCLRVYCVCV